MSQATPEFHKGVALRRMRQSDWHPHLEIDRLNSNAHLRVATFKEMQSSRTSSSIASATLESVLTNTPKMDQSMKELLHVDSITFSDDDGKLQAPLLIVRPQETSSEKTLRSQYSMASTTGSAGLSFEKPTATSEVGWTTSPSNAPFPMNATYMNRTASNESFNGVPMLNFDPFAAGGSSVVDLPQDLTARLGPAGPLSACERLPPEGPVSRGQNLIKLIEGKIQFRRLLERGIILFNNSPEEGLEYLQNENLVNLSSPEDVAEFLLITAGLNKHSVVQILSRSDPFSQKMLDHFIGFFDFRELALDEALRYFLSRVQLKGEAQIIERIVFKFAERFAQDSGADEALCLDTIFLVTYALIMLNTDLHNRNNKKNRMSKEEFVQTMARCKIPFSKTYVNSMYTRISLNEFKSSMSPIDIVYERLSFDPRALAAVEISSEEASKIDIECLQNGFTLMKLCRSKTQRHERILWLSSDRQLLCWSPLKSPSVELEIGYTNENRAYVRSCVAEGTARSPTRGVKVNSKTALRSASNRRGVANSAAMVWAQKDSSNSTAMTAASSRTMEGAADARVVATQENCLVPSGTAPSVSDMAIEKMMYKAIAPKKTKRELLRGAAAHHFYDVSPDIACANLVLEAVGLGVTPEDVVDVSQSQVSKTRALLRTPVNLLGSMVRPSHCSSLNVNDSWTDRRGPHRHAGASFGAANQTKWLLLSSIKGVAIGSTGSAVMRRHTRRCPVVGAISSMTSAPKDCPEMTVAAKEPYHILTNHVSLVCTERTFDFVAPEESSSELLEFLKYFDIIVKRNYKQQVKKAVEHLKMDKEQRNRDNHRKLTLWQRLVPQWSLYCESRRSSGLQHSGMRRNYSSESREALSRISAVTDLSWPNSRAEILAAVRQFVDAGSKENTSTLHSTLQQMLSARELKATAERGLPLSRSLRLTPDNSRSHTVLHDGFNVALHHERTPTSKNTDKPSSGGQVKYAHLPADFLEPLLQGVPDALRQKVWMATVSKSEAQSDECHNAAHEVVQHLKAMEAQFRQTVYDPEGCSKYCVNLLMNMHMGAQNIGTFSTRFEDCATTGSDFFRDVDLAVSFVKIRDVGIPVDIPCLNKLNEATNIDSPGGQSEPPKPALNVVRRHTASLRRLVSRASSNSSCPSPDSKPTSHLAAPLPPLQGKRVSNPNITAHSSRKDSLPTWRSAVEELDLCAHDHPRTPMHGMNRQNRNAHVTAYSRRVCSETRSCCRAKTSSMGSTPPKFSQQCELSKTTAPGGSSNSRRSNVSLKIHKKSKASDITSCSTTACISDCDDDAESSCVRSMQSELTNLGVEVLDVFVLRRPEIGYVTGLDRIATTLSYYLHPCDAVKLMTSVLDSDDRFLYGMFTCAAGEVEKHVALFDQLFDNHLPDLASYFRCLGLDVSFFWFHWLYSFFQVALPISVALRCWDVFFVDPRAYSYCVSLAVLAFHSPQLLSCSLSECIRILHSPPCILTFKVEDFMTKIQSYRTLLSDL